MLAIALVSLHLVTLQPPEILVFGHKFGGQNIMAEIAKDGNIVPHLHDLGMAVRIYRANGMRVFRSWPSTVFSGIKPNDYIYEYRSDLLIPMMMDDKRRLVPEAGGKIITYQDYLAGDRSRKIYNLPQHLR